jgi:two-component system chemotaxis response regulator CheB
VKRIFLLPGELAYARAGARLTTLLGSCVAVCLHDRARAAGGMNHFLLPRTSGRSDTPGRYGDTATEALIAEARAQGARAADLEASLYGGGNVLGLPETAGPGQRPLVGEQNAAMARAVLSRHGIPIVHEDVGGTRGRRIVMNPETHAVQVQLLGQRGAGPVLRGPAALPAPAEAPIRVVLVDASAAERRLLRLGLTWGTGIEVVGEAGDAYVARELILAREPDALCVDLQRLGVDGALFIERVRNYRPIPTVVTTAAGQGDDAFWARVHAAGVAEVVLKETLQMDLGSWGVRELLAPRLRAAVEASRGRGQGI